MQPDKSGIHKPKELPEEPIREKAIEEVVVKPKKKSTPKERVAAKKKAIQKKLEERKTKWIRDKNIKKYLELRKQHLKLSKKEILNIWIKTIDPKNLQKSDLKKFYSSMLNKYPELKGNNFAVFKTSIYKEGKVVDEVTEMVHSGPKKLYENFLDTVSDQKFKDGLKDFEGISRKNDSEVKYIFNFIQNHVYRGDYFVIETTNVFIACDYGNKVFKKNVETSNIEKLDKPRNVVTGNRRIRK